MLDVDQMLMSLTHLDVDDLKAINARTAALLNIGPKQTFIPKRGQEAHGEFAELMYAAVSDLLRERTGASCMPYSVFARGGSAERYRQMITVAFEANREWHPKQTKAELASMVRLYGQIVIDHLSNRKLPLTWHSTIPNAIGNLPALVEESFPGYAASGLLGMVQARRVSGVRELATI